MSEIKHILKRFLALTLIFALVVAMLPAISMPAYAAISGEVTGLTDGNIGLSYSGDKTDTWTASGKMIRGSVQSSKFLIWETNYDSTLTITNKRSIAAILSFDYEEITLSDGAITVDGSTPTINKSFSKELAAGDSIKIYIKSGNISSATTIKINNISLMANTTPTVTFKTAINGSYTVDGVELNEDKTITDKPSTTEYTLVARPDAGYQFKGWYDSVTGKYKSTNETFKFKTEDDCEITANFAKESVGLYETGTMVHEDLDSAIAYAESNNIPKITLLNSVIIEGEHTIPKGITLLIPFDKDKTLFKEAPTALSGSTRLSTNNDVYSKLTLAAGATITVEGAISVGGQYRSCAGGQSGYMSGTYGQLYLENNSSVNIKNGGSLYAWGFVSGPGMVIAQSGASVYEWFQIMDFRGGKATLGIKNKVFPFNQYSVQNIESKLQLNQGARDIAYAAVYASSEINTSVITFIGDDGLFKVSSGNITKEYDGTTDRMIYTVNGSAELNNLNLELSGMSVSSKDYVLPITNNTTVNLTEGSKMTLNQTTALLAGVVVNIENQADLSISNDTKLYIYDHDDWFRTDGIGYACYNNFHNIKYAPSKGYERKETDMPDAKVNIEGTLTVESGGEVYTTSGGSDICTDPKKLDLKSNDWRSVFYVQIFI